MKNLVKPGLLLAALLGTASAFGQYGVPDLSDTPAAGAQTRVEGIIRTLQIGDQVMINNQLVTIDENTFIPRGADVKVDGKAAKVLEKGGAFSVGIYPGTGWFLGGAIPVDEFGTVEGGTTNVWGTVLSAEYRLPTRTPLSLTGWYYLPMSDASDDLYQIGLRYMFSDSLGFQIGYLDSTEAEVDSATFQFVFRLRSGVANSNGGAWELNFLSGLYYNWSDFIVSTPPGRGNQGGSARVSRTTAGFSLAIQGGLQLSKTYSLLGSYWFVNDRNLSISRLGVGVGIKF